MFKINSEVIKIEAKKIKPINTGVVFWSHDRGTAKLKFKLMKDNVPQPIPDGTTVPIRLTFSSPTAEGGIGKHDYLATIEDKIGGIVSITLQDNILGYQGIVHGSIYMDFPGNTSLDTAGRFSFEIQRSPIDETTPELEDYYFNGFSKTIDKIEEMISQAENRIDGKVDKVESKLGVLEGKVDQSQGTLDRIEDEIKESAGMTEKFINSIDFGDYDYSGRPNLAPNLDFSKFSGNGQTLAKPLACFKDHKTYLELDSSDPSAANTSRNIYVPNCPTLIPNNTYIMTVPIMINSDFDNFGTAFILKANDGTAQGSALVTINPPRENVGTWQNVSKVFTVPSNLKFDTTYLQLWQPKEGNGKTYIGYNIKIEKVNSTSDTATPYQPNLLDAPYYLSNAPLGENVANKDVQFPIKTSEYLSYIARMIEPFVVGETYTITIKATKPVSQTFMVYNSGVAETYYGNLKPVDGLSNVWSLTFTPQNISPSNPSDLRIFQYPQSTSGAVQIDWLKIEKGDTRTPNIDHLRYRGIGVTKNLINKYLWEENTLLEKVYTNSIDFGDYDYSGNPNLMTVLKASDFLTQSGATIEDFNGGLKVTFTKTDGATFLESKKNIPALLPNKQYTLSADVTVSDGYTGKLDNLRLGYRKFPNGTIILPLTAKNAQVGKKTKIFITANSSSETDPSIFGRMYFTINTTSTEPFIGTVLIENIKVEEGTTATPYQPNLLDEPYYLSKVPLRENLIKPESQQPVTNSNYLIQVYNTKPMVKGKKYTITLKGTKPATQVFRPFFAQSTGSSWGFGDLKPVEGLTDIWSATFTFNVDSHPTAPQVHIYQVPNTSVGQCTIKWLKLEEGDTRTPNILCYKYRGVNNFVSKNPKDYIWDINNDYAQQIFDDTVSLTKPQTIISAKNFEEVPTVKNQLIHYGPQLFEGWYGSGEQHAGMGTKARLRVGGLVVDGRDQLSEPFTWNSGRYEATVNRDITFYCKGTMFVEMGGNIGKYIYIANWKNSEQTQYASGMPAGVGTNLDGGLYYRNMLDFSWIVQLRQGDKFSIGIELADGKTVSKIQIRTLHIKELVPPTN